MAEGFYVVGAEPVMLGGNKIETLLKSKRR